MRQRRSFVVAMVGITAALAFSLGSLGPTVAPGGGRVSLADVPVLLLALIGGTGAGVAAGAVYGFLHFVSEPISTNPLGFLLDYPIADACLGLAGLFAGRSLTKARIVLGILLGVGLNFLVHVISGVLLWGAHGWMASCLYNASYRGPVLVLDLAIVPWLALRTRRLWRAR